MKKNLMIVISALVFSLILNGFLYFNITQNNSKISSLEQQTEALTTDFESMNLTFQEYKNNYIHANGEYDELMSNYEQLTETYDNYVSSHAFSNSDYATLQNQLADIENQLDELNDNYIDLLDGYDELLTDYELISGPVSDFDTIGDFQIEINVDNSVCPYTNSLSGDVSVYYTDGTPFVGTFYLNMFFEGGGGMASGDFEINGQGQFIVEPPQSFYYGPGEYTISIGNLKNSEGHIILNWNELRIISVTVDAK